MTVVQIEMDRGAGWEVRQHGDIDQDIATIAGMLVATIDAYCVRFPHRALVDGVIVACAEPVL